MAHRAVLGDNNGSPLPCPMVLDSVSSSQVAFIPWTGLAVAYWKDAACPCFWQSIPYPGGILQKLGRVWSWTQEPRGWLIGVHGGRLIVCLVQPAENQPHLRWLAGFLRPVDRLAQSHVSKGERPGPTRKFPPQREMSGGVLKSRSLSDRSASFDAFNTIASGSETEWTSISRSLACRRDTNCA